MATLNILLWRTTAANKERMAIAANTTRHTNTMNGINQVGKSGIT
uniref:Uncharacterized protein n=1 Tax=Ciona intestinalis TaxID=7719 RepID=H2XP18_CIOIN